MDLLCRRLHVQTLRACPEIVLQLVLPTQRRQCVRRVVMRLVPRPNVHLLAEMFDHLLDRMVMVTSTGVPWHATSIAARTTALLRRGRVRTIPAQALNEAGIVKAISQVGMSVHTRRVFVHWVSGLVPEYRTTIPVRQQRRRFVLLIRPRVRKILVIRFVLVNVVQVMRKELVRWRWDIPVVQRTTAYLQTFRQIISVSKSMVIEFLSVLTWRFDGPVMPLWAPPLRRFGAPRWNILLVSGTGTACGGLDTRWVSTSSEMMMMVH